MNISYDGYLSLMDDNGELKNDLKVPEGDIGKEMSEKFKNNEEVVVSRKLHTIHFFLTSLTRISFTNISHTGFTLSGFNEFRQQ